MAEPSPTRADLERLRRQKRLKELEEKRIRARSAANGQTPQFDIPVDPSKQSGALNTDPLDRVVDSFQNYNPQSGAGIKGPLDAFLFKGVNALTGGALQRAGNEAFEGTSQEGFGDQAVRASDTFPVGAVSGQIAGSAAQLLPAQRAVSAGRNLPVIKPIVDAVGKTRAGSYLGRLASGSAAWAGESALQGATTVAEEQSAYTGEKPTLESRGDLAKQLATMNLGDVGVDLPLLKDAPINVLGPVASSVARRVGTGIATQGASVTPEHVRKSVQASTGRLSGGPEQMRSVAEVIDAELAGGLRPQAIAAVQRLLKGSGLTSDDIMTLNRTVSERANAATGAAVGRKSIGQLYDEVLNDPSGPIYRPQASLNILGVLRERRMNMDRGDGSAGIIGGESRALRDSQKQILEQSARDNLGQGSRVGLSDQVAEAKSALSSEYNRVLAAAPSTGPGADTLKQILLPDPNKSSVLSRRAKNAGFVKVGQNGRQTPDVDAYINARPYEAAHWMRSKLSQASRSAQGAERMVLGNTVEQLDDVLDQLDTYAATKRQWGTEESLLGAQKFGDRLFGGANSSLMNNPGMRDELIRSFDALPDSQKPIALVSIRDAALGRMQGGPAGQSARLTALTSDAAIDFFNRVGARGFADDLTTIKNEQSYLSTFDPDTQSRTGPNQQAVANAPSLYGSTASNAVRADGQGMGVIPIELAASQVAPGLSGWYAGYRGLKAVANKAFDLRNATKEDMTRFLMARPNRQELPMRGQSPAPGGVPNAPPSPRGPSGGSTPPNAGTPGPEFPHVVRHDDGQEWGFKTRAEAEEFAARPSPPSAPAGALPKKGGYSKKDKALDATAVGLVAASNAGTADAQETSDTALGAAQQRVTDLEGLSAQIEADLAMLNDVNADPKQLQMILQRRVNPELVIDGVIGPQTRQAISAMRTQLVNEQDKMRVELGSARERATELEQRQIYADNSGNPMVKAGMEQLPLVGTALGALIGLRGRGGAVKKSRLAADALEDQANGLLNPAALPQKSVTGPNSLNARAANLNEFWRLGGAGENVPFKMNAKGEWANKTGAVDPSELYKPKKNPFRTTDAGFIAGGLGESALATQYLGESKEALKAAEARLQQAEESGNLAAYEQAMAEIEQQRMMIQIWTSMQRVGLGVAGFRGMAALKSPYANARPNLGGAQQEQALLLQGIQRGKTKLPKKPRKKPPEQAPANDR